jgi:hypothetical protein
MTLGHLRQNLVAYVALAVAVGTGTAYAAPKIADGSVTTKKLATNAVTSAKIKNGAVKAIDIRGGAVTSFHIADGSVSANDLATGSVTSTDVADDTVTSADVKDNTLTHRDINDSVVPQDADILVSLTGEHPSTTPAAAGLNAFAFTLPRNAKVAIEFFAGELGVDCAGSGQGQIGLFIDGLPRNNTLTDVPGSADAGAVQLVAQDFLQKGDHVLSIGEQCVSGVHGPTVPAQRVTWQVHVLAR